MRVSWTVPNGVLGGDPPDQIGDGPLRGEEQRGERIGSTSSNIRRAIEFMA